LCLNLTGISQHGGPPAPLPEAGAQVTLAAVARRPPRGQRKPRTSHAQSAPDLRQIQWAGYGAALAALGLILIWQSKR
jgi:hypothetical protein